MSGCVAWTVVTILCMCIQGTHVHRPDGFLGDAWGTPFSRIEEKYHLVLIERSGSRATYMSNLHRLDDAEVDECHFEFVHDRFAGVVLSTQGKENSERLLRYLRKQLGEGQRSDPTAWTWISSRIHVSFDIDSYGDGYVYWYSLEHQQE
jgi:hypothetical protein